MFIYEIYAGRTFIAVSRYTVSSVKIPFVIIKITVIIIIVIIIIIIIILI